MSNAARGTFEELLKGTAPELADIARRLRDEASTPALRGLLAAALAARKRGRDPAGAAHSQR